MGRQVMTVIASNFKRQKNDLYETEEWATRALLRHIDIVGKSIWEPSAGNHKIADVLFLADDPCAISTTDIQTYDRQHTGEWDFFSQSRDARQFDWIITNPPYGKGNRLAVKYAELALERADNVALLLTAKFDFGKTRKHLFKDNPRFSKKIALLDRIQWFEGATTGTEDHAWYVWEKNRGRPEMLWEGK
jgi:hypothetical protein